MVSKDVSNKAETKGSPDVTKANIGGGSPRGGNDEKFNDPEPSGVDPKLPSDHNPKNPSDRIHDQIKETDARTKVSGDEYDKFTDEQLKDAAVKMGIDGNDNLSRGEILEKIARWKASGRRMIPEEPGDYQEQKEEAKEQADKDMKKLK
jgi:hypothetical protein